MAGNPGEEELAIAQVEGLRQWAEQSQSQLRAELDSRGISYRAYWIVNLMTLIGNREIIEFLQAQPNVRMIEPDRNFQAALSDSSYPNPDPSNPQGIEPGLSQVGAAKVWAAGVQGDGIVVASADTGVQWDHPALKTQYRGWDGSSANHNYNWWDAIHAENPNQGTENPCGLNLQVPCDDHGHGTHTTGTMVGDDGIGNQVGMAPKAKWIACRNMESGWGMPSTYIECLQWFLAPTDLSGQNPDPSKRPHVINNSYACTVQEGCQSDSLTAAIQQVRASGIFFVASAGNSGPACNTIKDPPAIDPGTFTVGGVNFAKDMYDQSSRGPASGNPVGIIKPDLVAPAEGVRSSISGGLYGMMTGTSMASPHVAGAVALLWSGVPGLKRNVASTEAALRATAFPLSWNETCGGLPAGSVPNYTSGWGQLDTWAAYHRFLTKAYYPIVQH